MCSTSCNDFLEVHFQWFQSCSVTGGSQCGLFVYVIVHTKLPPSPVILCIEMGCYIAKMASIELWISTMLYCAYAPWKNSDWHTFLLKKPNWRNVEKKKEITDTLIMVCFGSGTALNFALDRKRNGLMLDDERCRHFSPYWHFYKNKWAWRVWEFWCVSFKKIKNPSVDHDKTSFQMVFWSSNMGGSNLG